MISRPIREGFRGVGRHWAMAISAAIAVTVTLIIISIFLIFTFHLQKFTRSFEQQLHIYASVDYEYESAEKEEEIKEQISKISGVADIVYHDKDEEYQYYLDHYKDERVREFMTTYSAGVNPMHDAFYVEAAQGSQLKAIADQVKEIEGVFEVTYGGQSTVDIVRVLENVRKFGAILVAALSLLAIFLIQNTIKLTISAREDEIRIMRNVGATNGFIRAPFVWEGIIIGFLGALIPLGLTYWVYQLSYEASGGVIFSQMFQMEAPFPFLYYLCGILLLVGIVVGLLGSWFSVNKQLRWRR